MRVAALYDVHGNVTALEAVLHEVEHVGVDLIVVGGDVTLGPQPRETLALLRSVDTPVSFIEGNCDRDVLAQMASIPPTALPEQVRELVRWTADQLQSEPQEQLRWPKT